AAATTAATAEWADFMKDHGGGVRIARAVGGDATVSVGALPATLPAPPRPAATPPTPIEDWGEMVHTGAGSDRAHGREEYRVISRVTRAGAKRSGMTPGAFALMASQDDIERSLATEPLPGT
ncbi:unnamed protein product, partial [Pylaiella littoralis]